MLGVRAGCRAAWFLKLGEVFCSLGLREEKRSGAVQTHLSQTVNRQRWGWMVGLMKPILGIRCNDSA